ncbi:hypothetical protein F4803DRAFT_537550 [Xylaria telfairii]|nr:hypothetical protein F4803DRAFT_537550 [Xylaria telfairii]
MDPLSVLGVASNAIQIIDFGVRFFIQFKECYQNAEGDIEELSNLRSRGELMQRLNTGLIASLQVDQPHPNSASLEREILSICTECQSVVLELNAELNRVSRGAKPRGMATVRTVLKATWRRKDLSKLHARLESLRGMLTTTILVNIQRDLMINNKTPLSGSTTSWEETKSFKEWMTLQQKNMEKLQSNLLEVVERSSHLAAIKRQNRREWHSSPISWNLKDSLLRRLKYGELDAREERIAEAYTKTFDWIYSSPSEQTEEYGSWSDFKHWLEHGNDIYWITGKPGSGKSTLMKMLTQDPRTLELLRHWSGSQPLVTAKFYFWASGTEMQKSQEGLVRSLLYQALAQRFEISLGSPSSKWGAFSLSLDRSESSFILNQELTWNEIHQAYRLLVEEDSEEPVNYVFFVDGLDEYSGDLEKLISLIRQLSSYPNVKFCVSSRPWNVFESAFNQQANLMLQHRTRGDIAWYAEQKLQSNAAFRQLQQYNSEYARFLIENITSKASGVFLWVVLVVRSLLEGLDQGDKATELHDRLDELPDELDQLFKKLLHGLQGKLFRGASHLFQLVRASDEKPHILALSLADEDDDDSWILDGDVGPFKDGEIWHRSVTMKRRLDSRCQGLLEIGALRWNSPEEAIWTRRVTQRMLGDSTILQSRDHSMPSVVDLPVEKGHVLAVSAVDYLHRTVKDFLEQPEIWKRIEDACESNFDPHAALFKANLALLKTMPLETLREGNFLPYLFSCVALSRRFAPGTRPLLVTYLDALDRVAIEKTRASDTNGLTYMGQYWTDQSPHWGSTLSKGQLDDDFMTTAVRCDLQEYIHDKLGTSPPSRKYATKLLETALTRYNVPGLGSSTKREEPNSNIVDFLVEQGADYKSFKKIPLEQDDFSIRSISNGKIGGSYKAVNDIRARKMREWLEQRDSQQGKPSEHQQKNAQPTTSFLANLLHSSK